MRSPKSIHIVEPGGRGGVYQHAVALADAVGSEDRHVTLHTATDPELMPTTGFVDICGCVDWHRHGPGPLRRIRIASSYLRKTLPHLRSVARSADVFHFQGVFREPLTALTLCAGRAAPRLCFSPHNAFVRSGRRRDEWALRRDARTADVVFTFTAHDRTVVKTWGAHAVLAPLLQVVPQVDAGAQRAWRERLTNGDDVRIALVAGQLRPDKGIDILIRAVARLGADLMVALVGEDHGVADKASRLATRLGVRLVKRLGYLPLDEFVAAIAAADALVCPHRIGSQSGAAVIGSAVGTPVIAPRLAGLAESSDDSFAPGDDVDLASALERSLAPAWSVRSVSSCAPDITSYLTAYEAGGG